MERGGERGIEKEGGGRMGIRKLGKLEKLGRLRIVLPKIPKFLKPPKLLLPPIKRKPGWDILQCTSHSGFGLRGHRGPLITRNYNSVKESAT